MRLNGELRCTRTVNEGEQQHENAETDRNAGGGRFCALISAIVALSAAHSAFAEDAYIQSDGANTINTGYYASGKTKIEVDFQLTKIAANYDTLFGHYGNDFSLLCYCVGGKPFCAEAKDGGHNNWPLQPEVTVDTARHTIVVDAPNRHMTLSAADGTLQAECDFNTAWTLNKKSDWPLLLFGSSKNAIGEPRQQVYAKIYGAKIWETENGVETLLHDYVPATKGGAVGFYDKETGDFLPEQQYVGSKFTAGGDGVLELDDDPYVESDGTGAINTGIVAQPKMKIELDYTLMDATDPLEEGAEGNHYQQRLFGQDTIDSTPRISVYINNSRNITLASGDGWNAWSSGLTATNKERHTLFIDNASGTRGIVTGSATNKVQTGQADITKYANRPLALFGDTTDDEGTKFKSFSKMKVYGLRIWADGALERDFEPRCIDGVAGFEDRVTGRFYTCAGLTASATAPKALSGRSNEGDGYIESDGSICSSVDTRYFINSTSKIVVDYQLTRFVASGIVMGGYGGGAGVSTILWCKNASTMVMEMHDGGHEGGTADNLLSPTVAPDLARHTAIFDGPNRHLSLLSRTGEVVSEADFHENWKLTGTANWPMLLFASANSAYGGEQQRAKARIYSVRVYEGGDLVHEYLPCVREGVPGFKDTKTGRFYSGNGLTAGGNVPEEAETDPYIDTGTSGAAISFDTGYYVTKDTAVVCDYMSLLHRATPQQFPFEAGDSVTATNASQKCYMRMYCNGSACVAYACGDILFKSTDVPYRENVRRKVTLDAYNKKVKVETDGEVWREIALADACQNPNPSSTTLKIFSNGSGSGNLCMARLYGFQIYEKGVLVRDYKPYVKDGLIGLMETASNGGFLPIAKAENSSQLSYGGNIEIDGRTDAYIENDGVTALNLGYKANMKSRIEFDFQWLRLKDGGEVVCGAWNTGTLRYCFWHYKNDIEVIFDGKSLSHQTVPGIAPDFMRHTAVLDMKNRSLAYVTGGVSVPFTVNSAAAFNATDASVDGFGVFDGISGGIAQGMTSYARVYAVRIYEDDELIHEFLPYKNGEVVSLRDTKTGYVATKTAKSGVTNPAWPTIGGMGVDGAEKWLVEPKGAMTLTKNGEPKTIIANAAGAVSYKWTKNDEAIEGGENGELTVSWEKRSAGNRVDTYTVTPVYNVFGTEVDGEPKTIEVTNAPLGMMVILR